MKGFTLIELLSALLVLSLLALMSYRGLGAVLDARAHVRQETEQWRRVATFFSRFERDIRLAAPRTIRADASVVPAWQANSAAAGYPALEFSRFGSIDGADSPRRVAYVLNDRREIELWIWPGLDRAPRSDPARYPVLTGVASFELLYLSPELAWVPAWPRSASDPPFPQAVQLRVVLVSREEIVRVFALRS